ncbi:hypothetical protein HRR83_003043 [Exophiala dermatitidis]|nr:hypothetical protein HRR73_007948 [Exophiala dermatitidis]KAJ4516570.1 hypothetical protein HRR75_003227 [Exophiala dermatitidis]KAJ4520526.1 hypothetical protein HRR74_003524 [Exophiala dermatitidis]KAJ4537839.1 hypothetical protein HRR76_005821 [Exophiala dermatitidis]KAJ4551497.1 hypothetical protein HRR77_002737 [Exophiala dermatitidis]
MASNGKQFSLQTLDPTGLASSKPLFSHVTTASGDMKVVFIAGQVGMDENGNVAKAYEDQVRQTVKNIGTCLAAAGAKVTDIVKVNYYIVNYDPNNRPHVPIVLDFYAGHRPSTMLVPVPCLAKPELLFEMDVTAVIPRDRGIEPIPQPIPVTETRVDVVVVGGGLSGLQAGLDCQNAGLSTIVLEARNRVGGKTWSVPGAQGKGMIELGGAWINDTNQSHMYELAKKLKLDLIQQLTAGDCVMHDLDGSISKFEYGGVPAHEQSEANNMIEIRALLEKWCHEVDLLNPQNREWDSLTLEDFIKKIGGGPTTQATARLWTRGLLGVEPREMSALYFLDYVKSGGGLMLTRSDMKHGGQFLRIRQGAQSFSKGLAAMMKAGSVQLDSPVRKIEQDKAHDEVCVTTESGYRIRSKRVVISVPTPLYKEITFSPPLPAAKHKLASSTALGWVAKSIVCYDKPWWRAAGYSGLVQSFNGPITIVRDTSSDMDGHYSLTCFSQGDTGRAWGKLSDQERREQVIAHIGRAFANHSAAAAHIGMFEQRWALEQWSQGCPSPVMGPGLLGELGHALRAPFQNLHFVGTETAYEWKGYMEGAVRSGKRGAKEVITALLGEGQKSINKAKM